MTFRRTRCPHCKGKLEQGQRIHSECIDGYADAQAAKAQRAEEKAQRMAAKVERAETRRLKEDRKRKPELLKEAQAEVNKYVRWRDREQPCISCGRPPPDMTKLHAGRDAGHYRSVGSAPQVRFDLRNIHAQCVSCNQHKAGNAVEYRLNLIKRIGLQEVEALEAIDALCKWTHDELREIRDRYRAINRTNRRGI